MLQKTNKFKINNPIISDLDEIKYSGVIDKEIIENFSFNNDLIKLNSRVNINSCKFENIVFECQEIISSSFTDIIFINCDLSKLKIIDSSLYRIQFINCKLLGTNIIDSKIDSVEIKDSLCDLINISSSKIKGFLIGNSSLKESTIYNTELKNVEFDKVNFNKSEIINTSLKTIDLSSSSIEGLKTDFFSIKGSIINSYQAMDLIGLLDVRIK